SELAPSASRSVALISRLSKIAPVLFMPTHTKHAKPLILLACQESHHSRELASALVNGGFRVSTTGDEPDTMEAVQTQNPHGIIIDAGLAPPGLGLCRMLRVIAVTTPIILTHTGEVTRA